MHYTLSPAARRTLIALLVGVLVVWAFALWSLITTVGSIPGQPQPGFFGALQRNVTGGLGASQLLPALLMLVVSVAAPLVMWGMLEEYGALYSLDDTGLHFESYGLALAVPWTQVAAFDNTDADAEAGNTLVTTSDTTAQIANPVVRWLYTGLHGRTTVPIYAGLEQREELVAQIHARTPIRANAL